MKVLVVKAGSFKTNWSINKDFAFTNEEDLHAHMEQVNGFKCLPADDIYSVPGTRFINEEQKYGYDIVTLEVFGTPDEVVEETILLDDLSDEQLKELAKEKGIKSWHIKSKETLIKELSSIPGGSS